MHKKSSFFVIAFIILFLFTSCSKPVEPTNTISEKSLLITGDIEKEIEILGKADNIEWIEIEKDNEKYKAFNLQKFVELIDYDSNEYHFLFISTDGMKIKTDSGYDKINIFINSDGWNIFAPDFPPTINLRDLKEIVLIKNKTDLTSSTNIITQKADLLAFSPGKMHLENLTALNYKDGVSSKNNTYTIEAYKEKLVLPLSDKLSPSNNLLMTYDGGHYYIGNQGFLELKGNRINYIEPASRKIYFNIAGILINPPQKSVMDVYHDTVDFLEAKENVMVLYIDGLSLAQYNEAVRDNLIPFMGKLSSVEPATSVYKPVTNSGYAAMITGQPPFVNGILNRSYREPKVDTIFDYIDNINQTAILIEGNTNILSLNTEALLNTDKNNNGYTDDEVYETALSQINNQNFALVHFHGYDDAGHTYGPYAKETMNKLTEIDGYVKNLVELWSGKIIITSDHGMHATEEGGSHGDFRYEDLIIPYIITEGGL